MQKVVFADSTQEEKGAKESLQEERERERLS
jgi:hypothetical protein